MEALVESRKSEVEGQTEAASFRGAKGDTVADAHATGNRADGTGGTEDVRKARGGALMGGTPIPLSRWREISGITVENERTMTPKERRAAIRKLKVVFEQEIREELKEAAEDSEFAGERTYLWDPVAGICHRLEIGPTVLSRMMKELTGMSATQMVDRIRAEGVREKLKEYLRVYMYARETPGDSCEMSMKRWWELLKTTRSRKNFSLATWAIELGFSSYSRFYRACLLCYGKTPTQIENEILKEYAEWYDAGDYLARRIEAEKYRGIL